MSYTLKRCQRLQKIKIVIYGQLEVTDKHKFIEAFRRGIGPGKGFGLGLLLAIPVQ